MQETIEDLHAQGQLFITWVPHAVYAGAGRPTARWVFQCFEGIAVIYLPDKTAFVANVETRNQTIIDCLGEKYQKIYS